MGAFSGKQGRLMAMYQAQLAQQAQQAGDAGLQGGQTFAVQTIDGAQPAQLSALEQGYDTERADLERARGDFQPFYDQGVKAWQLAGDATGVNGADGYGRAQGAFQATPGYAWNVDQNMKAVQGQQAALGELLSGNTLAALQDRGNQLANQEYGNWYSRVAGLADTGYNAAGRMADLAARMGASAGEYGRGVADVHGRGALAKAGIYTDTAAKRADLLAKMTGAQIDSARDASQAGERASENRINAALGAANTIATVAGRYLTPSPKPAK